MRLFVVVVMLLPVAGFAQSVIDPTLRVNKYVGGFDSPTGMAFLDDRGTILVTEKNTGQVKLVENRKVTATILDLPVANDSERGLLSIATSPDFANDHFVYIYHTAAAVDGGEPISNKISRYFWDPSRRRLVFDRKIIDLPPGPGPNHDGGKIVFAPNGKLFTVIGDLNRQEKTSNFENSPQLNRTAAILRLQPNGRAVPENPFATQGGGRSVQGDIWAYGIRNSFGLAFDPVTGDLWDTENGPDRYDEINRVTPGFNSGWRDIQGPISRNGGSTGTLFEMGPRANYQDPKLSWVRPVAPTDLEFMSTNRLGDKYLNDLFMGDVRTGSIYRFELTSNRKSLQLTGPLEDRIVNNDADNILSESGDIVLGSGFGVTSDLITGPGGLYVLSLSNGTMYRIALNNSPAITRAVPEPLFSVPMVITSLLLVRPRRSDTGATPQETAGHSAST